MKVTLMCRKSGCVSLSTRAQTTVGDLKFEKTEIEVKIVIITIITITIITLICTKQVMHHAIAEKPLTDAQPVSEHWSP